MKILVTGREGQVARSLAERVAGRPDVHLHYAARPEVDLAETGAMAAAIEAIRPDLVLNAAAYTAVDGAESDAKRAMRINAHAAGEGAAAAAALNIPFVQLSTDYVFDGSGNRPWREDDPTDPINVYGLTKAAGERLVLEASPAHLVVRTSWLVGPFGQNFVKTMLRLAADRDEISVVDDQRGRPTNTLDLADALLDLLPLVMSGEASGLLHLAGAGEASWADLATEVMRVSADAGGPTASIRRIATSDYPTPAPRPANSILDCTKARDRFGIELPVWSASIGPIVTRLAEAR